MISMSRLGDIKTLGRLGNSMFQYAFLRSRANALGCKYACPRWRGDDIFELKESNRIITSDRQSKTVNLMNEKPGFTKRVDEIIDGTEVLGYFQSPKYWDHSQVKNWYSFKSEIKKCRNDFNLSHRIGVHVRRGDYQRFKHIFNILGKDYYLRAIKHISCRRIALFSDDLNAALKLFKGERVCVMPVKTGSDIKDMFLMSQCEGMIMANSSFSWWASCLNKHQNRICYPKQWYAPNTKTNPDIAREGWYGI